MQFTKENQIGKGSSRTVYADGEDVIKRAHGLYKRVQRGIAQNQAELSIWERSVYDGLTILCPVIDLNYGDEHLRMKRAIMVKDLPPEMQEKVKRFKRDLNVLYGALWGCKREMVKKSLIMKRLKNVYNKARMVEVEQLLDSKLFKDIVTLVFDYELMLGDIKRLSSWGYYKGRFVLIDYGATKTVLEEWYDREFSRRGVAM